MSLRDRIRRLEQSHGVEPEQRIHLLTPGDKPKPTQEQIDAFAAKLDWKKYSQQILAWTGDKFVCNGSDWLIAQGCDGSNFDPEREIVFCTLKKGVTP
jgi:hypothetical protein